MSDSASPGRAIIRTATPADVPRIYGLLRELAEYERLSHALEATAESLHDGLFGRHPVAESLIAEVDGQAVGYALYFTTYSTFVGRPGMYLEDLYVQPHMRGRGIGRQLLAELAKLAVERDYGRLEWAVLDWNQPSIEFYKRLGARAMSEWTVYRLSGAELAALAHPGMNEP